MNSGTELISIIIPCFNAEKWIAATIESCLAQSYQNFEVVIVDDGSTDQSLKVIEKYLSNKVKLVRQQKRGACAARNKGFEVSKGDFIQYLDADDLLSVDKLEKQLALLRQSPDFIAVSSTQEFMDGDLPENGKNLTTKTLRDNDVPAEFLIRLWGGDESIKPAIVQTGAWFTPRKLIEETGPWDMRSSPDDDGEFFCRVVMQSAGIRAATNAFIYWRAHTQAASLKKQSNYAAYQGRLFAIFSKKRQLFAAQNNKRAKRAIAIQFLSLGLSAYPDFPDVAEQCMQEAQALDMGFEVLHDKKLFCFGAGLLGWKNMRRIRCLMEGRYADVWKTFRSAAAYDK